MGKDNETVTEIVREMRERTARKASEAWYDREAWAELCGRLEAASRRQYDALGCLIKFVVDLKDHYTRVGEELTEICAAFGGGGAESRGLDTGRPDDI